MIEGSARAHEQKLEPEGQIMGPRPFGKLRRARRFFPKGPLGPVYLHPPPPPIGSQMG